MLKAEGCAAYTKVERSYALEIPFKDNFKGKLDIHADEQPILDAFTTSVDGKLLKITYKLHCFIKHDSWNEFGEGNCVTLPIKILQPPVRQESQVEMMQPQDWRPVLVDEVRVNVPDELRLSGIY